jgi:uncharacterized protein (TIGR02265 family)
MAISSDFVDPPWNAPLDVTAALRAIPESATISGMFLMPLVEEAKRVGVTLPSARDRYVPFRFYPVREHASLLLETCERLYPDRTVREGLRKLGRGAPRALLESTLGRVMLGTADGVEQALRAMARAYPLNARPCSADVVEAAPGRAIVRLQNVTWFLDSHHVGTFEGVLRFAGAEGSLKIRSYSAVTADLLCTWQAR